MYSAYQSGQSGSASPVRCLVLAVRGRRAAQRRRELARRSERRRRGVDPPGQPAGDLLDQPAVPVGIVERRERAVALTVGIRAGDASFLAGVTEPSARRSFVEHLTDLDTVRKQHVAGGLEVLDDQVQALGRTGRGRRDVRAELDRAAGARRRELDDPEVVARRDVGVEPPVETAVEGLGAIDVGDRDDDHLESQVGDLRAGGGGGTCLARLDAHLGPPLVGDQHGVSDSH